MRADALLFDLGGVVDAGVFVPHAPGSREYLAVERGSLRLTLDGVAHTLRADDSIYYAGDRRHVRRPDRKRRRR